MTSLPDELVVDIIARVPRRNYPTLSLVSKRFRSMVASPELYNRRSVLGCTEPCLYALIHNGDPKDCRLYIYKRTGLVLVPSLPHLSYEKAFVVVGSKIYVVDGRAPNMLTIDCRFHTVQSIPDIPKPFVEMAAAGIDRKIYVIGVGKSSKNISEKGVMVFDTETQTWESGMLKSEIEIKYFLWRNAVVMADKIYVRNSCQLFVYGPKENKWEVDEMLAKGWYNACVLDDMLYCYCNLVNKLTVYDPKQRCWGVVKGIGRLLPDEPSNITYSAHTVSYGEKLAVFLPNKGGDNKETWCAEIALERHQGGEIWGKVECCDVVIVGDFYLTKSFTVKV